MTKKRKLIYGVVSLITVASIALPLAIVSCSYDINKSQSSAGNSSSNSGNQTTNNASALMNIYYNPTLDGAVNSSNQFTKTIFVGGTLPTFSVEGTFTTSSNVSSISYQWYSGTVSVKNGVNVASSNSIVQDGATSSTFTPSNTKLNQSPTTLNYYCVVTAKFADGTTLTSVSNQFNIDVLNVPTATFYTSTSTYSMYTNSSVLLSVNGISLSINGTAISSTGLNYQWYSTTSSTVQTNTNNLTKISGANTSSYSYSSSSATTEYFYLEVSGLYDGAEFTILSPQYTVNVYSLNSSNTPIYVESGNNINKMSVSQGETTFQTLTIGGINKLTTNNVYSDLTYQWYKDGNKISGATTDSYTLNKDDVSSAGTYNYYVIVTGKDNGSSFTYTSANFVIDVVNYTIGSFSQSPISSINPSILDSSGNTVYLLMPNQKTSLPGFTLTPSTQSDSQNTNFVYTYTWYFINLSDPKLVTDNSVTQTTNTLVLPWNWMSTYKLSSGTTYAIVGTVSATLNGSSVGISTNNTVTINGQSITIPNSLVASTTYFISIAESDPSITFGSSNSTGTSSLPYIDSLTSSSNSTASSTLAINSSIVFNNINISNLTSSGPSSYLGMGNATFYWTLNGIVSSQTSSSGTAWQSIAQNQVMNYSTSKDSKTGLYSLTFSASTNVTRNEDSLSLTQYQYSIYTSGLDFFYNSSVGYVKSQFPNTATAEANLKYLLSNSNYALQIMQSYFNSTYPSFSSSANSVANFSNNLFSELTQGVSFGNVLATVDGNNWSSIATYLSSSVKWMTTLGISLVTQYSSRNTSGSSVSIVSAGYTNSCNGAEVPFNTLLINVSLVNYELVIGNYAKDPSYSAYVLSNNTSGNGGTDGEYVPFHGYLHIYLPFNPSSPTNISINSSTGVPTLTWSAISDGAANLGFSYTNNRTMFIKSISSQTNLLIDNENLQGVYFPYNTSMNTNIQNNPLIITSSNTSLLPTYDIASSTTA